MEKLHSVCVFCGSRAGAKSAYRRAAQEIGRKIAENGWRLVFGAGDVGLMGECARAHQAVGGPAMGVVPTHLMALERPNQDLSQLVITQDMHERKKVMFMNSDAIVVLPGGVGTLDEFFEVLTWRQIGLHEKDIILLDIDAYWAPLMQIITHAIDQGFAEETLLKAITRTSKVDEALSLIAARFAQGD